MMILTVAGGAFVAGAICGYIMKVDKLEREVFEKKMASDKAVRRAQRQQELMYTVRNAHENIE